MVLDDLQILLPNFNNNPKLNLYIRKAVTLITAYLNLDTVAYDTTDYYTGITTTVLPLNVSITYPDAICDYVTICVNKQGSEGIKQQSQGSRSMTFSNDLPDSTKALLPLPYAVMLDTSRRCYDVYQ